MNIKSIKCPGCGAPIDIDLEKTANFCSACGSKLVIDLDADAFFKEKEKTRRKQIKEEEETKREELRQHEETKRTRMNKFKGPLGLCADVIEHLSDINQNNLNNLQETKEQEEQRKRRNVEWYASLSAAERKIVDEQKAEEDTKKKRALYASGAFLAVIFIISMILSNSNNIARILFNEANPPTASIFLNGKSKQEVESMFKDAGFTNIVLQEKSDTGLLSFLSSNGQVSSVTINGCDSFSTSDLFPKNSTVTITYIVK